MTKLQDVLNTFGVTGMGFEAMYGLTQHSQYGVGGDCSNVVVSTLPASVMEKEGIKTYFAPQFERGQVFKSTEELIEANPDVNFFAITEGEEFTDTVIVSRHDGTVEILKEKYPDAEVLIGNVDAETVRGKHVVGTLPPHLVSECALYTHVGIKDFDYNKDGDIKGAELLDRIEINEPIGLDLVDVTLPKFETLSDIECAFEDTYIESHCMSAGDAEKYSHPLYVNMELEEAAEKAGFKVFYHCEKYEYCYFIVDRNKVDNFIKLIFA